MKTNHHTEKIILFLLFATINITSAQTGTPPDEEAYGHAQVIKIPPASIIYTNNTKGPFFNIIADEIMKTSGKGDLIMASFPYITDRSIANALNYAAQKGAEVYIIIAAQPGIKNYAAPDYMTRNGCKVYFEPTPAEKSSESYILLSKSATTILITIPPDPTKQSQIPCATTIFRSNVELHKTMSKQFTARIGNQDLILNTGPNSAQSLLPKVEISEPDPTTIPPKPARKPLIPTPKQQQ